MFTKGNRMDRRMEARIAELEAQIVCLKKTVAVGSGEAPQLSDRRGMVKLLAASAVGAMAGGSLFNSEPAAAAQGQPVVAGTLNTSTDATAFESSGDHAVRAFGQNGVG